MSEMQEKKRSLKWLVIVLIVCLALVIALAAILVLSDRAGDKNPGQVVAQNPVNEEAQIEDETAVVPLATKYIILSYPAELEDRVTITYEDLEDGQQIIFTTDFTGDTLELFRFSISKSGTSGHLLGTLTDEEAGELSVCVDVYDHGNGNLAPEKYAELNAMQERVNDIIVQFYADSRFTPNR